MEERTTERGFECVNFPDIYGKACSLQESSLATVAAVWLGVDEVKGAPARMHLNKDIAKELVNRLQRWIEDDTIYL